LLTPIPIPSTIDEIAIPGHLVDRIRKACDRIEAFQDRWDRQQIEQFVAADYELIWQAIHWMRDSVPMIGNRFLEWGCGFAVVSAMAVDLGLDAIGIEAENDLLAEGQKTMHDWGLSVELFHGNFLPPGANRLATDSMLPSLGHPVPEAYSQIGLELDDFAVVYSYPWPGEDDFHELVFDRYAENGALLLQFCGPNDVRLWRKVNR